MRLRMFPSNSLNRRPKSNEVCLVEMSIAVESEEGSKLHC